MDLPLPFFFLVGLLAVTAFFVGGALAVFGLVVGEGRPRVRLAWLQTLLFVAVGGLALYAALLLHEELAPWRLGSPPERSSDWTLVQRDALSVVLVGLASVFLALTDALAWVRVGRAGAALRSVVWAPVGVRLVLDAVGVVSALADGDLDSDGAAVLAERVLPWAVAGAAVTGASLLFQVARALRRRRTSPPCAAPAPAPPPGPDAAPSSPPDPAPTPSPDPSASRAPEASPTPDDEPSA